MMQAMTVYLLPDSSLRGSRPPRSDTLFGAICWAYRLLFGMAKLQDEILQQFHDNSVPFLVSSMFRYAENTLYFPKPYTELYQLPVAQPSLEELDALKKLRKKTTVKLDEFVAVIEGKKTEKDFYEEIRPDTQPRKRPVHSFDVPHVTINLLTGAVEGSQFFYTEEYFPSSGAQEQAGLFFLVKCYNETLVDNLQTVFHFLGDKGIGGVSVGKGHFRIATIELQFPYQEPPESEATHVVTLSLTFPCAAIRSKLSDSWYDLERRQGKIESMYANVEHIWKDHLLMLKEGSTFPKNGQPFYGENRIVRRDDGKLGFDVRHYGYTFTVNTRHVKNETGLTRLTGLISVTSDAK